MFCCQVYTVRSLPLLSHHLPCHFQLYHTSVTPRHSHAAILSHHPGPDNTTPRHTSHQITYSLHHSILSKHHTQHYSKLHYFAIYDTTATPYYKVHLSYLGTSHAAPHHKTPHQPYITSAPHSTMPHYHPDLVPNYSHKGQQHLH